MQTHTEGTYGATSASWSEFNPRAILKSFIDKTKDKKDTATIFEKFREHILKPAQAGFLDWIIYYYCKNTFRSLIGVRSKEEYDKAAADREVEVTELVDKIKKIVLLDHITPIGKKLRDCSRAECGRCGSWYAKLSEGEQTEIIGDVYSEMQLRQYL